MRGQARGESLCSAEACGLGARQRGGFALTLGHRHSLLLVCCGRCPRPSSIQGNIFKVFPNLLGALGDSGLGETSFLSARCCLELFVQASVRKNQHTNLENNAWQELGSSSPLVARTLVLSVGGSDGT